MQRRGVVHTHHKTGTIWMRQSFREICTTLNVPVVGLSARMGAKLDLSRPMIALDPNSRFPVERWQEVAGAQDQDRRFHLIRDPRDVIISAAHYHCTTDEAGFHVARDEFEGRTYQQKINSLTDNRQRYLFEMDHFSKATLRSMARWDYSRSECFECIYEDLIADTGAELFSKIATHLGFEETEMPVVKSIFLKNSIFAGTLAQKSHVRAGGAAQWRGVYDRSLAADFLTRFGDILIKLGYEKDDAWMESLPDARESTVA